MKHLMVSIFCLLSVTFSKANDTIPYNVSWAYHTATSKPEGIKAFFDNSVKPINNSAVFGTNWVLKDSSEFVFTFPKQMHVKLTKIRFYDGAGVISEANQQSDILIVSSKDLKKIKIGEFGGALYNQWVEYDVPNEEVRRVILKIRQSGSKAVLPQEIQFVGSFLPFKEPPVPIGNPFFKNHIGENFYPYDIEDPKNINLGLDNERSRQFKEILSCGRFYADARWLEPYDPNDPKIISNGGNTYTFQSSHNGGHRFDDILKFLKDAHIPVIFDVKESPDYIRNSYSGVSKRHDVIPIVYNPSTWNQDIKNPLKYDRIARLITELTIRYGRNSKVDPSLTSQYKGARYNNNNSTNLPKVGMDLLNTIEVGNENNKFWGGRYSYQTGYEYAAMLSACYDGHKGALGPNIGMKKIDKSMKLSINGLVGANPGYLQAMIDWCEENRGLRPDGSIDICWDAINWHMYTNDAGSEQLNTRTRGAAPETVDVKSKVLAMRRMGMGYLLGREDPGSIMESYLSEYGFDVGNTIQQAIPIEKAGKSREQTQADWILRTILVNMSLGTNFSTAYQYRDDAGAAFIGDTNIIDTVKKANQYTSSGATLRPPSLAKRPIAWIFKQVKESFGEWQFDKMVGNQQFGLTRKGIPGYNGDSAYIMRIVKKGTDSLGYVVWYGTEFGQQGTVLLKVFGGKTAIVFEPDYFSDVPKIKVVKPENDFIRIEISEKPVFITFKKRSGAQGNDN